MNLIEFQYREILGELKQAEYSNEAITYLENSVVSQIKGYKKIALQDQQRLESLINDNNDLKEMVTLLKNGYVDVINKITNIESLGQNNKELIQSGSIFINNIKREFDEHRNDPSNNILLEQLAELENKIAELNNKMIDLVEKKSDDFLEDNKNKNPKKYNKIETKFRNKFPHLPSRTIILISEGEFLEFSELPININDSIAAKYCKGIENLIRDTVEHGKSKMAHCSMDYLSQDKVTIGWFISNYDRMERDFKRDCSRVNEIRNRASHTDSKEVSKGDLKDLKRIMIETSFFSRLIDTIKQY